MIITMKDTSLMGYHVYSARRVPDGVIITLKDTCLRGYYYYYPERQMPDGVLRHMPDGVLSLLCVAHT